MRDKYVGPTLPNGWPVPTFMNVDEDGFLTIEWCFGKQGEEGSWRILYTAYTMGGQIARLTHTPFTSEMSTNVLHLDKWLKEAMEDYHEEDTV